MHHHGGQRASRPELPAWAASSYISLGEKERPAEADEVLGREHHTQSPCKAVQQLEQQQQSPGPSRDERP